MTRHTTVDVTRHERRYLPVLLFLASLFLLMGMVSPVVSVTSLGLFTDSTSLLGGIVALMRNGSPGLAVIIGVFSVVFPITKLVLIGLLHRGVMSRREPPHWWLVTVLGKWSMLDVFVVATFMGSVQLGLLSEASAEWGIYLFAIGVLLSMVSAMVVTVETGVSKADRGPNWLVAARCVLLVIGLVTPLMAVEKWWFWQQEFSMLSVLPQMIAQGEWLLPLILLLFVVGLPVFSLLCEFRPRGIALKLDLGLIRKWSMLDVFVVSMLLVFIKLGSETQVKPLIGFWLLMAVVIGDWLALWLPRAKPVPPADPKGGANGCAE